MTATNHHWCRDPSRDEAARASEDNRLGPLPTLEEVIETARAMMPKSGSGSSAVEQENKANGMRTERVVLEIMYDHRLWNEPSSWAWNAILKQRTNAVRVVDEMPALAPAPAIAGGTVLVNGQDMVTLVEFLRHTTRLTQEAGVAKAERDAAIREAGVEVGG